VAVVKVNKAMDNKFKEWEIFFEIDEKRVIVTH